MNKKTIKIICIVLAVVIILPSLGLLFAGYQYSFGPFSKLGDIRVSKLEGNSDYYSFDKIERIDNKYLTDKNVLFLGSSVTFGYASMQNSIPEYFGKRFGCNVTKEAVSGTTLVDNGPLSYVSRLKNNVDKNADFDIVIVQLSTNDATKNKPLGEISSEIGNYDTKTITGAIEYIIDYCITKYNCKVFFYTGSRYDSDNYKAMVDRLYEIKKKWGFGVLDLYTDDDFNNISEKQRNIYMSDDIHPTMAGYRDWWCPEIENQILEYLYWAQTRPM